MKTPQEVYDDRREELVRIRAESIESLDKAILQLSTGVLVITVTFLDKIGKPYDAPTLALILLAWVFFILVIALHLLSFHFATKNADFKIEDLNSRAKKYGEKWTESEEGTSCYKKITERCNRFALSAFIIGIALFLVYAGCVQYKQYREISKPKKETSMSEKKPINEGLTEVPEVTLLKKGQTEAPEQVIIIDHPGSIKIDQTNDKEE